MALLMVIDAILILISLIYVLYLGISYLLWKDKEEVLPTETKQHRFAILIPARNEGNVIDASLQAIHQMNYPKDKYDTYVLINNTSDDTLEKVNKQGDHAFVCKNTIHNKGDVLKEFFANSMVYETYDAFVILDADNRIDADFLAVCNRYIHAGYRVGQGMKTAYNPYDTWISGASSLYFSMANHIINLPRGKKQLSGMIFGSGFYVTSSYLKELGGWVTTSMTEDIDMTFLCAKNKETVAVMDDAITYDVQPLHFQDAWKQRVRWLAGTMEVRKKYHKIMKRNLLRKSSLEAFDSFILLYTGDMAALAFCVILLTGILFLQLHTTLVFVGLFIQWLMCVMFAIFLCKESHFQIRRMWKAILWFWLYLLTFSLIAWRSVFYKEKEWKEIRH